jgi:serine/threonine-protein kinase
MTLSPGAKLGPYEIDALLGSGGMGEVYRAHDGRLNRTVAIKVLREHVASDPAFRGRFDREARAVAGLNHPFICTLHDIGEATSPSLTGGHEDGAALRYLVMEYLDGETLHQRLARGPLTLEQALQVTRQIADALDKAHRAGIVHRDLKPGNIFVTKPEGPSGTSVAKLLDFGLAKVTATTVATRGSSALTMEEPVTGEGTILGTLQYMAPEQLHGADADARTDVFALGAVLYEMVTGKPAFAGDTQAGLIGAILKDDPIPAAAIQPAIPAVLDRILAKCLAKDPERRWQRIRDVIDALEWVDEKGLPTPERPLVTEARRARWNRASARAGGFALLAAVAGSALWTLQSRAVPQAPPVSRWTITLPAAQQLSNLDRPAVAISPDGTRVVYAASEVGPSQLYLRDLDRLDARPLSGTEGATTPFFSPDARWLGFHANGSLKKISLTGGTASTIAQVPVLFGAVWSRQGTVVHSGVAQVPEAGGSPQAMTHWEKGEVNHRWPDVLPDGKGLLFSAGTSAADWATAQVVVQALATGERRTLATAGTAPRYLPSGHVLFAQGGTLMAVPFDANRLTMLGPAVPVLEGVHQSTTGAAQYAVSDSGSLVYVSGGMESTKRRLVWVDRRGAGQVVPAPTRSYRYPRLSPDGQQVAVTIEEEDSHIWIYNIRRDALTRFTSQGRANLLGAWSPDGTRVAYRSDVDGSPGNLVWQPADGSGPLTRLSTSDHAQTPNSWSPDGQALAFADTRPGLRDISVLRLSDGTVQPFLRSPAVEGAPSFSPDGRWLAYVSDESGRNEVYVQPYPGPGAKWQLSTNGGTEPVWNPSGREAFYREGDTLMAVDVVLQPAFSAGKPRALFTGRYEPTPSTFPNYDVSRDGQRFLMLEPPAETDGPPREITVVVNWVEELKRRLPGGADR